MWSVRMLSGPNVGQIFDLKLGKNIFGRGSSSDCKVQSLGISKEHCEIHVYKDKIIVIDLKSSNGTFVNGVKIQNSILRVGDKISLFDIIMDVIPTPDIRPKNNSRSNKNLPAVPNGAAAPHGSGPPPAPMSIQFGESGSAALQMQNSMAHQYQQQQPAQPAVNFAVAQPKLTEKIETFIETILMPAIYRLALIFPFKNVLLGFVILFIFGVTLLSTIPLTIITTESNRIEATKRAKSVAHAVAKINEQALLSGEFANLTVQDALKEDGVREAFIVQQSNGSIVAPSEKMGRDASSTFILKALKEGRTATGPVDSKTIGASYPIGTYDPTTGEPTIKYHAVVYYNVSSLNVDEGRVISLFMQTLVIASILGGLLYFLFSRLIEYPLKNLNQQINQALQEKTDRIEVLFDYPEVQKLTTNVNTLLNRLWNFSGAPAASAKAQQNRDLEYVHLVEMITQPAFVLSNDHRFIALNSSFEQICQSEKGSLLNQTFQQISDSSLVQNIESLVARAKQAPYEKHVDRIPFSQFECDIECQAFIDSNGDPEFYFMTLTKADSSA